jgi:peptidoglycan/LPS O-acetylase OafA/YrhL
MSIFQVKEDFQSLFKSNSFPTVDGLRALTSLSIIYLHVSQLFVLFIPMYPSKEWLNYLQSNSFLYALIFVNSLEIFFVLSGFLLTYSILTDKNNNDTNYFVFILKRYLRYYPGLILILLYMYLFGDLEQPYLQDSKSLISNYFVHLLFIVNYTKLDH